MYKAQSNVTVYKHCNDYQEYNEAYKSHKEFTVWSQQIEIIQQKNSLNNLQRMLYCGHNSAISFQQRSVSQDNITTRQN